MLCSGYSGTAFLCDFAKYTKNTKKCVKYLDKGIINLVYYLSWANNVD